MQYIPGLLITTVCTGFAVIGGHDIFWLFAFFGLVLTALPTLNDN